VNPPMGDVEPVVIDAEIGAVRQDPDTKAVAVRRDTDRPDRWAVMTLTEGGHYGTDAEVEPWSPLTETP
jgi:hypothetical protein